MINHTGMKLLRFTACGMQNQNDRIVNGEDVDMNEFPWQAALVVADTRKPFCGGALINDRFILTGNYSHHFHNWLRQ